MTINDTLSVIVTAYNCEKFISDCLTSIIENSYQNIEVIIVDNNSNDGTRKICKDFLNKHKFVKYIEATQGQGPSYARNVGLRHCSGDYVTFVDGDDYIDKDFFKILIGKMVKLGTDIEIGRHRIDYLNGKEICKNNGPDYIFKLDDNYNSFAYYASRGVTGCIFKKKVLIGALFNEDIFVGEDLLFYTKVLAKSNLCHFESSNCFYNYVYHEDSLYNKRDYNKKFTCIIAHKEVVKIFKKLKLKRATKIAKKYYCFKCYDLITELNKVKFANLKIKLKIKKHMFSLMFFIIFGGVFRFRFFLKWVFLILF